jgi:hypothetical protein
VVVHGGFPLQGFSELRPEGTFDEQHRSVGRRSQMRQ